MTQEEIERMQRCLIVHAYIYYELNDSVWSDEKYDEVSLKIVSIKDTVEFKKSKFYNLFKDFDGSTGFQLCQPVNQYWISLGEQLLEGA